MAENWWDSDPVATLPQEPDSSQPENKQDEWWQADPAPTHGEVVDQTKTILLHGARQRLGKSIAPNFTAWGISTGTDIASPIARALGQGDTADYLNRFGEAYEQAAQERDTAHGGKAQQMVGSAIRGAARTVPEMMVAAHVAGPYGAIAAAAGTEYNQALTEGKDAGMSGAKLHAYAAAHGAIEGGIDSVAQALGVGGLFKTLKPSVVQGVASAVKQAGWNTLEEVPKEILTELGHNAARAIAGTDPKALSPASVANTVAQTTLQSLVTMGVASAPHIAQEIATPAPDALQSKLDAVQQQYVKDESERKDNAKWLEQQAIQRDQSVSDSAYRQLEAEQRLRRQEADKLALDKHFRENMPQGVQPETIGGIRQLPLSPDVDLNAPPSERQPQDVEVGQLPERTPSRRPIDGTLPAEEPQAPGMRLTGQWQPLPADAPTPTLRGADVYDASDGTRYIRASDGGPPLQAQMQQRGGELAGMNIGQLNQEGSRYGLERGLNKGAKIKQILAIEEQRALSEPAQQQPSGQMIEPMTGGERQPVMLGLPNPISEIYDPRAQQPKSLFRKKLTDAVSQTQQEMENAAATWQEQRGTESTGAIEGAAPSENGAQIRREEGASDRRGDSTVQGGQEATVPADEVAHYEMLDFDSRGRLKARKKMPVDEAHRLLKGREVVFQKLLECLS